MTALIVRLHSGKGLPCPYTGSRLPGALSLFLVRLPRGLLVGRLCSSPRPLNMKEEAERSEARKGSHSETVVTSLEGKVLTQIGQWFSVLFLDPK